MRLSTTTKLFIAILTILTVSSCRQTPTPLTGAERNMIIDRIEQTMKDYCNEVSEKGLTAEFNYLDHSADFYWIPPAYTQPIDYDSVATLINQNAAMYRSVDNSWGTLQISPLRSELASFTGQLHSVMTDTMGKISTLTFLETGLLVKRKTGWKLLSGRTTVMDDTEAAGLSYPESDLNSALFKTLLSNDSLLFEVAFNQCDLSPLDQLVSEDFEFHHREHRGHREYTDPPAGEVGNYGRKSLVFLRFSLCSQCPLW